MPTSSNKVLVYLIGSLGDTIVSIPALRAVRAEIPDSEIVILQNIGAEGIVRSHEVIPGDLVDRYVSYNSELAGMAKLLGFRQLRRELIKEHFSAVVYLAGSKRSSATVQRDRLFFRSCGIKRLIGFHSFSDVELYPREPDGRPAAVVNEGIRKLERMEADGIAVDRERVLRVPMIVPSSVDCQAAQEWLEARGLTGRDLIAVAPLSKTPSNLWPLANFEILLEKLTSVFGCEVVIVGGPAERVVAEGLAVQSNRVHSAAGEFSVAGSAALLAECKAYVGVDSGTTHLAAAVGLHCFVINHERNHPGQWFPLGQGHEIVSHPVPCSGCILQECRTPGHPCMTDLRVEPVWARLNEFLNNQHVTNAMNVTTV